MAKKSSKTKTKMVCLECGRKWRKAIGRYTIEARCPRCGGYDTEPQ